MYLIETEHTCDNAFKLAVGTLVKKLRVYPEQLVRSCQERGVHSEGGPPVHGNQDWRQPQPGPQSASCVIILQGDSTCDLGKEPPGGHAQRKVMSRRSYLKNLETNVIYFVGPWRV